MKNKNLMTKCETYKEKRNHVVFILKILKTTTTEKKILIQILFIKITHFLDLKKKTLNILIKSV